MGYQGLLSICFYRVSLDKMVIFIMLSFTMKIKSEIFQIKITLKIADLSSVSLICSLSLIRNIPIFNVCIYYLTMTLMLTADSILEFKLLLPDNAETLFSKLRINYCSYYSLDRLEQKPFYIFRTLTLKMRELHNLECQQGENDILACWLQSFHSSLWYILKQKNMYE